MTQSLEDYLSGVDLTQLEAYLYDRPQHGIALNNPKNILKDKEGTMQWVFRGAFTKPEQMPTQKLSNDEAYYYGGFLVLVNHAGAIGIVDKDGDVMVIIREELLPPDSCDSYGMSSAIIDQLFTTLPEESTEPLKPADPLMDIYERHYGGSAKKSRKTRKAV